MNTDPEDGYTVPSATTAEMVDVIHEPIGRIYGLVAQTLHVVTINPVHLAQIRRLAGELQYAAETLTTGDDRALNGYPPEWASVLAVVPSKGDMAA